MIGKSQSASSLFQMVSIEELVPKDHILRHIDAAVDLSFIRDLVRPLYTENNGRPSIDPELALRMFVLGYLYNLSDNRLCEEIAMHAGYRWFCRLDFHDPVPDRTTLVKLRRERWGPNGIFNEALKRVVMQCQEAGLISGEVVAADGTVVRARAAMESLEPFVLPGSVDEYQRQLDPQDGAPVQAIGDATPEQSAPSTDNAKDPQAPVSSTDNTQTQSGRKQSYRGKRLSNDTHRSTTDSEARLYRKSRNEGAYLSYIVNKVIDPKTGVVLAVKASQCSGNAEKDAALEMLAALETHGIQPKYLLLDGGYDSGEFLAEVLRKGVEPMVPLWGEPKPEPSWKMPPRDEKQAEERRRKVEKAKALNHTRALQDTPQYKALYGLRRRIEHIFAESKQYHGLDRARGYGLKSLQIQALMTAMVQNMKRLAKLSTCKAAAVAS